MKSFRWNAIVGLVSGVIVGSSLLGAMKALTLPQELIQKKLESFLVFTVTDSQGAPLVENPSGLNSSPVAGIFINQRDAERFLEKLKNASPELVKDVRVVPVALSEIYKLQQRNQNKPNGLAFAYVPHERQQNHALRILNVKDFSGVPVFMARSGERYLRVQQNNEQVIPAFLDYEQLEILLARLRQQQPNVASSVTVQVVSLEGILKAMTDTDTPEIRQIVLVPPQESQEYLRSLPATNPSTPASSGGQ